MDGGDVPLQKVKFSTNQEYEYFNNFKVLQETFTKHAIGKVQCCLPVLLLLLLSQLRPFRCSVWLS